MDIRGAQAHIARIYGKKDRARGVDGTFMYFIEEVGELSTALREGTAEERAAEFADVFAWLVSLADMAEVDLEKAFLEKYSTCSDCGRTPCACQSKP